MSAQASDSYKEMMLKIQEVLVLAGNNSELQQAAMELASAANKCVQEKNAEIELLKAKLSTLHARAQFDYEGRNEEELSFREGDLIEILDTESDAQWYYGQLDGRFGVVPATYVVLVHDLEEEASVATQEPAAESAAAAPASAPASAPAGGSSKRQSRWSLNWAKYNPLNYFIREEDEEEAEAPRMVISSPTDFAHVSHVGVDANGVYSVENLPAEWRAKFEHLNIGEEYLDNPDHAQFAIDFVMQAESQITDHVATTTTTTAPVPASAGGVPPPPPPPPPPPQVFNKAPSGARAATANARGGLLSEIAGFDKSNLQDGATATTATTSSPAGGAPSLLDEIGSFNRSSLSAAEPICVTELPPENQKDLGSLFKKAFQDKFALVSSQDMDTGGGFSDDDDDDDTPADGASNKNKNKKKPPKLLPKPKLVPAPRRT